MSFTSLLMAAFVACWACSMVGGIAAADMATYRNCTQYFKSVQENPDLESWIPKCNPDGTYAPTQMNKKSGLKFCVSKEGIILVAPQRSLSGCDCPRKRFEKFQSGSFDGYIHRCDTDFTYSVLQYNPETNVTTCMMKEDEPVPGYSGSHVVQCKCPRTWYEAKTSPLPDRYTPQCNPDGTFKTKQCHGDKCWCCNQEGEQVSIIVPDAEIDRLVCP